MSSSDLSSLHAEVHPSLLPTCLGGSQLEKVSFILLNKYASWSQNISVQQIFFPDEYWICIAQGLDAAWVVAARQRDDDYKEKIRQVRPLHENKFSKKKNAWVAQKSPNNYSLPLLRLVKCSEEQEEVKVHLRLLLPQGSQRRCLPSRRRRTRRRRRRRS